VARPRSRFPRQAQRRRTDWSSFFEETFVLGTTAVQLGATAFTTTFGTSTLARIRGVFRAGLSSANAVNDGFAGAIGIGKVQDEAFAAGVGSVPSPITEVSWDGWLYHQFFSLRAMTAVTADVPQANFGFFESVIDVKSMRKIDEQEDFVVVLEAIETGAAVGFAEIQCRSLELLP